MENVIMIFYNMFINDKLFILYGDVDVYNCNDDNTFVYSGLDDETVKNKLLDNVNNLITWF